MARCSEISGFIARGMPTRTEEELAATQFRSALMQSRVLGLAGRFQAAQARATDALDQAETLGFGEFVAEAHLVLGRALAQGGRYADAEQHLREAVLGGTRSAHDEAAAEAEIALVEVVGVRLDRHAEASLWEAQAGALLDRISEHGILRARLENRAGRLDSRRGDYTAARAHYTAALSLRSKVQGNDDPGRAAWLIDLGNVALAEGQFDEAIESFDRALALAEATLTASHPARAASLAALGRVHLRREEYGPAREALLKAKSGLEGSLGEKHPRTAMVLLGLANADEGLGNAVAAEAGYARAADLLGATLGREHVAYRRALLGRSRSARLSDRLEDAVGWLTRACGGPAVPTSLQGVCILERAEFDFTAERFDDAASGFTNAAARFEAGALADPPRRAQALLGVARSQRALGRNDEAARALEGARTAVQKVKGYVPNVRADLDRFSTRVDPVVASSID